MDRGERPKIGDWQGQGYWSRKVKGRGGQRGGFQEESEVGGALCIWNTEHQTTNNINSSIAKSQCTFKC